MNERIKEFYNKAWLKVDPSNPQETFTNAFAELIVRECARVAVNTNLEDVEGGDSDVLYAAYTQIKQHFGVE